MSYNEQKVKSGKAEMILASRFGCELNCLGFTEKLNRFERLNSRSQKVTTNTIHISLNFSPYELIDNEKMQAIAMDYMKRIGFEGQPFLVYRHTDSNHPHMHIVASIIRANGRPINIHNIGKSKSEPARKAIESEFALIPAETSRKMKQLHEVKGTKQNITNTVNEVIRSYHFSNLEEFNLILKQHLVVADTGRPGTKLNLNKGLLYSYCDRNGNNTGIPIKASSLYNSPTLKVLEKKFEKNKNLKHLYSEHTANVLKEILNTPVKLTEVQFKIKMAKQNIMCHFVKDESGIIADVMFVDNRKKVVLSCSDLNISVKEIADKAISSSQFAKRQGEHRVSSKHDERAKQDIILPDVVINLLQTLMKPEYEQNNQLSEFLRKKIRKRKRKF